MANLDSSLEMGLEPAQDRLAFPCKTHHRVARDGEADAVVRGLGDGRAHRHGPPSPAPPTRRTNVIPATPQAGMSA